MNKSLSEQSLNINSLLEAGAFFRKSFVTFAVSGALLLSPQAADRLASVAIDKDMRAKEKPSDHVPIRAQFRN